MRERGMLKWAPYKSLEQQADYLARMEYDALRVLFSEREYHPIKQKRSTESFQIIITRLL